MSTFAESLLCGLLAGAFVLAMTAMQFWLQDIKQDREQMERLIQAVSCQEVS